jgi:hypothetical protein
MTKFQLGNFSFSLVLGFLIGSSHSPVVGVTITALMSLISAAIGYVIGKQKLISKSNLPYIGVVLLVSAIGILVGVFAGGEYRYVQESEAKTLPWTSLDKPDKSKTALDWIVVSEILSKRGYTSQQIRAIYLIKMKEKAAAEDAYGNLSDVLKPLSETSSQTKQGRNPASE